jgi:hypothetical protein
LFDNIVLNRFHLSMTCLHCFIRFVWTEELLLNKLLEFDFDRQFMDAASNEEYTYKNTRI